MAYKMSYNFEGNHRTKPEQNLSGASQKLPLDILLQKTHEERRKRQEQRLKLQSVEVLQSHLRSYIVRKVKKEEERAMFDNFKSSPVNQLLTKLLFFYEPQRDYSRLYEISERLLRQKKEIFQMAESDAMFPWLIKRWLMLCLKNSKNDDMVKLMLDCIQVFSDNSQTVEYLVRKGYYVYLRKLLENCQESNNHLTEQVLTLIRRPFVTCQSGIQDVIMSEFCTNFLKPTLTKNIKTILIPYLNKSEKHFPYDKLINYLNSGYYIDNTNSLFYCLLALEPDDYDPTLDYIQVLANLSQEIHKLQSDVYSIEDSDDDDDDDEDEEDGSKKVTDADFLLSDFLHIMNRPERVRKLLNFTEGNEEILIGLTKFCHNLLLVYKDSFRKYLLLYKLGLNGNFLNKLWHNINNRQCIQKELKSPYLVSSWKECHSTLSVFCDMFTFYTETLTDRENSDTSDTFTQHDLSAMSKLLKNVSMDLVELAFPMCRASSVSATPEMLHLYNSCLNCVKMLYMLDMRKQFCSAGFWTAKKIHISTDLLKKNYLSKTVGPFYGLVNDNDDEDPLPPLSTIELRSLAILQQLPFLISFNTRVLLLRDLCKYSLGDGDYSREFSAGNLITIRRTYLYEDAFEKLFVSNDHDLRHKVRIQFINRAGIEEAGIDGGGIFKEFLNEILRTAFDPNRGFFLLTAENTLYPNPNVHLIVENFTDHYYFIGRLIGKAIFESILVDLPLAEFFLAKLLVERASAHYLNSLDPVLYKNLLYLRDYVGDVSDLGLDFTTINNDLGETRMMELKPNGRNIPVTNENRLEYIQRLADLKLNVQLRKQCTAFREGLDSIAPVLWLKLFNHNELQVIIGGDNQEIDLSDLRAHTVYGGEFTVDHPTVLLFWKVLHKFTDVQRKQLLKFVTSCSRPPLLGFKELNPQFCIHSTGTEDRMPTASTCLNLLKLPTIRDEETLRSKILCAIVQQAGFELS